MKNSLKNNLKTQYENLSENPSKNLWEKIENELENDKKIIEIPKKAFNYWKIAAVVLLFISLGFLFKIYFNKNEKLINNQIVEKQNKWINNFENKPTEHIIVPIKNPESPIATKTENPENSTKQENKNVLKKSEFDNKNQINIIKDYTPENKIAENKNDEIPKQDSPKILKKQEVSETKTILAQNTKPKQKYITADELLFEREVSKTFKNKEKEQEYLGNNLKLQKPKEIKVLGFTVYSEDNE